MRTTAGVQHELGRALQTGDLCGGHLCAHFGIGARRKAEQGGARRRQLTHRCVALAHHTGIGRTNHAACQGQLGGGVRRLCRIALGNKHLELGFTDAQAIGADEAALGERARLLELGAGQRNAALDEAQLGSSALELEAITGVVQTHQFGTACHRLTCAYRHGEDAGADLSRQSRLIGSDHCRRRTEFGKDSQLLQGTAGPICRLQR